MQQGRGTERHFGAAAPELPLRQTVQLGIQRSEQLIRPNHPLRLGRAEQIENLLLHARRLDWIECIERIGRRRGRKRRDPQQLLD